MSEKAVEDRSHHNESIGLAKTWILNYYESHPDKFIRSGRTEEVMMEDFGAFISERGLSRTIRTSGDSPLDSSGRPIKIGFDYDMDFHVSAHGKKIWICDPKSPAAQNYGGGIGFVYYNESGEITWTGTSLKRITEQGH